MKKSTLVSLLLLALVGAVAVSSLSAQDAPKEKKYSQKTLEKYDKNKDGKLDADEIAEMKADKEKAKAERKAKKEAKEKTGAEK